MDKRYQVFISSTYADLKEERSKVIQTVMELDCIPAGMELFPAIDDEQFDFIKKVIDDCDYYILIIGGRYGSLSEDGISYTEKEFDYAKQKGIKIIAFVHQDPSSIPVGKSDISEALILKLDAFRSKASTNRLVKFWNTANELPGLVALSLAKTIKTYPATGWVRANFVSSPETLQELNEQRKENQELREKLNNAIVEADTASINNAVADFDDPFVLTGTQVSPYASHDWSVTLTWKDIFFTLSPYLMEHPSDSKVKYYLTKIFFEKSKNGGTSPSFSDENYQTVKIHLLSLGLITVDYNKTTSGGMDLFWSLTAKGRASMKEIRTVYKK